MEIQLRLDDLGDVQEAVFAARTKWYNIGLRLRVPVATLDSIKRDYSDTSDQLRETLKAWLQTSEGGTWMVLVKALRTQTVGESQLAAKLEEHCSTPTADLQTMTSNGGKRREESQYPVPKPKRSKGPRECNDGQAQLIRDLQNQVEANTEYIRELQEDIKAHTQQLEEVWHKLETEMAKEPMDILSPMSELQTDHSFVVNEEKLPQPQPSGTTLSMTWQGHHKAPVKLATHCNRPCDDYDAKDDYCTCTSVNQSAFFNCNKSVYGYNSEIDEWFTLPDISYYNSTLTTINDKVTAVGGSVHKDCADTTDSLLGLSGERLSMKWSESFPPMPSRRCCTAVTCTSQSLIVAGGTVRRDKGKNMYSDKKVYTAVIEVMNTSTQQWSTVSSLPHPLGCATATIYEDRLCLLERGTRLLQSCSVINLLQSPQVAVEWHETTLLKVGVSLATLCEQLVAVGGTDVDEEQDGAIHVYDPETNMWKLISKMPTARSNTLVVALPGNRLMVVGGQQLYIDRGYDSFGNRSERSTSKLLSTVEIAAIM